MASGEVNRHRTLYSVQNTYIINPVVMSGKGILTCDQRIDIPTIEPLSQMKPTVYPDVALTVVPCIELAGSFLSQLDLTFETNEGVTVLPINISPQESPYRNFRYVLVLPRGATGVKSCKIISKYAGIEIQHNFTFGIMPPPYNYDNALLGDLSHLVKSNGDSIEAINHDINILQDKVNSLKLTTRTPTFNNIRLPKGEGKQTINIEDGVLFYNTTFSYPSLPEPTIHNPKITLHGGGRDQVYTLSLNKGIYGVSIDLLTAMITAYDRDNGEIIQQFMIDTRYGDFEVLAFENFDDIDRPTLTVTPRGARVE